MAKIILFLVFHTILGFTTTFLLLLFARLEGMDEQEVYGDDTMKALAIIVFIFPICAIIYTVFCIIGTVLEIIFTNLWKIIKVTTIALIELIVLGVKKGK